MINDIMTSRYHFPSPPFPFPADAAQEPHLYPPHHYHFSSPQWEKHHQCSSLILILHGTSPFFTLFVNDEVM